MKPLAWLLARGDEPEDAPHAAEIRAELEHHLACARAELERAGLTPAAAAAEAERRFGARERIEAECLAVHGGIMGTRLHAVVTALLLVAVLVLSFVVYSSQAAAVAARDVAMRELEAARASEAVDKVHIESLSSALARYGAIMERPKFIDKGDRIHLRTRSEDWQFDATVDADGKLSIPDVGVIVVEGLTREELEYEVGAKFSATRPGTVVLALINATPQEVGLKQANSQFPSVYEERR